MADVQSRGQKRSGHGGDEAREELVREDEPGNDSSMSTIDRLPTHSGPLEKHEDREKWVLDALAEGRGRPSVAEVICTLRTRPKISASARQSVARWTSAE